MNNAKKYIWSGYILLWVYFIFFNTSWNQDTHIFYYLVLGWIPFLIASLLWKSGSQQNNPSSVEDVEYQVKNLKESIFKLEHFDSPHFIDCQNAFDAMEVNYFRLKQRFTNSPEKGIELAQDWYRYAEALYNLKFARLMLDVDLSDNAWDNAGERMKEPSIIKEEIEKKYEALLGKDWQKIPDDYFKREETIKKPKKYKKGLLGEIDWKYYYSGDNNLYNLLRKRQAQEEKAKKT